MEKSVIKLMSWMLLLFACNVANVVCKMFHCFFATFRDNANIFHLLALLAKMLAFTTKEFVCLTEFSGRLNKSCRSL